MGISLIKAGLNDCRKIHAMQILSFKDLLEKYKDYEISPGAESYDLIVKKMSRDNTDYYLVKLENKNIGAIRVVRHSPEKCRISPMFLLPEHRGNGYAKQILKQAEALYPKAKAWELDTIKQEKKLCCLYESMDYIPTGKEEDIKEGMTIIYYRKEMNRNLI